MKSYVIGLLSSALFITYIPSLHAEEQDAVIVTATRSAITVDDALASVTVLTESDIEQSQAQSLQELLQGYAGLDFHNNGGAGKYTNLFMRGTDSTHVLVMIDGIKIGSATLGRPAFQDIPVSQIERIEIVRGPRSSLYGSEAIGGVIQIFTKKGHRTKATNLTAGFGSNKTKQYSLGFEGNQEKFSYRIQANHQETDGFSAIRDNNPDDDGYINSSLNANVSYRFNKQTDISWGLLVAAGENEFDNSFAPTDDYHSEFVQSASWLKLNLSPADFWQMSLQAGQSRDEFEEFANGAPTNSIFNTRRDQASWLNNMSFGNHYLLTLGVDTQEDSVVSTTDYTEKSRTNTGVFMQHQWMGSLFDFQLGAREDDNQAFGTHTTENLAMGISFLDGFRVYASYGTAFKAPTFNQLYWPDTGFGGGNPNLKPEESETTEIGLQSKHSWGRWEINTYRTEVTNLISGWPPENSDKAEITGTEFRLSGKLLGLQHSLDISYTDPQDKSNNRILERRVRESMRYSIDNNQDKLKYGITFINKGESYEYDFSGNATRVDGYQLVNLRTRFDLDKTWWLQAKVENALDEEYESVDTYNTADRTFFISIHSQGL